VDLAPEIHDLPGTVTSAFEEEAGDRVIAP